MVLGVLVHPSSSLPIALADGGSVVRGQAKKTVIANNFPGADLGAKINAADKALGNAAGEILVRDGGTISTQVIINSGHSLRFSAGTYRIETQLQDEGAFLLKSRTSVTGSGWNTVIVEPPKVGWIVFQSYEDIRSTPIHYSGDSQIAVSNLQIKGANPATEGSVRQTITLGNCHDCHVENIWFNGTGIIGVAAGGSALAGKFADTVTIRNNQFTQVAGQAVAVVNGRNVIIEGNRFIDSGRRGAQGMVPIDIEPNASNDIIQNIQVINNVIDSRGSNFLHGNGIVVQNGAATLNFGPVLVKGNRIMGGGLVSGISGNIASGIYIASLCENVTVTENLVQRVAHSGIRLEGSKRISVTNNKLISTGTGGIVAFEVQNTSDSQILNNVVAVDPNSPLGNSAILESGNSRGNVYRGNTDGQRPITFFRR
jgi:parallel beta-helix repeat protein